MPGRPWLSWVLMGFQLSFFCSWCIMDMDRQHMFVLSAETCILWFFKEQVLLNLKRNISNSILKEDHNFWSLLVSQNSIFIKIKIKKCGLSITMGRLLQKKTAKSPFTFTSLPTMAESFPLFPAGSWSSMCGSLKTSLNWLLAEIGLLIIGLNVL
jgi:hypothetical protein